ncbi:hypothetical protein DU64_05285 [Methanosarcina mazei]|uniref:DUF2206 domain-containing protein n=2 Tax=Methanosarcina mazei TaxID=2209 RepID=A0A0F8FV03_METMZ|nr:hypothetical protein DU64_05285 [Methanosarcina mazei]KKG57591.1 hypothetical protein DU33_19510 [Methanosarcina mazei]KKG63402.1 hypothetical protein DU45_20285 [Methanosarcina mazei]
MQNIFQLNNWDFKKFFILVVSLHLALIGSIYLDVLNFVNPLLRYIVGFIYLTFIPGFIILRILKIHDLSNTTNLLFTVASSISFIMIFGCALNTLSSIFSLQKVISLYPILFGLSISILILICVAYIQDRNYSKDCLIKINEYFNIKILFFSLFPFLTIFGTYIMNLYGNNTLLLIVLFLLSLVPLLVALKLIETKIYSYIIWCISICLLFHRSLISMYLIGWDINYEYYIANLVLKNSIWDPTFSSNVNSMLSISILAPIYSIISGISLIWILKAVYPFLFSLVPVGLYQIIKKQTDDDIAFFSCFFFMSIYMFYGELVSLARQQIAEFFFMMIFLLIIDETINRSVKSFLSILFYFSLIISHYGLSYIFMFSIIFVEIILYFYNSKNKETSSKITYSFILLYTVLCLSWYMYTSDSSTFNSIIRLGNNIISNISEDFFNPVHVQGLEVLMMEAVSPIHQIHKYLQLIVQLFISIGVISLLLKRTNMNFNKRYIAFTYINFLYLLCCFAVPFFASSLNTTRLYQITLLILSPFFIVGGIVTFKSIIWILKKPWSYKNYMIVIKLFSVFLLIFLLFNSGFIYEITKDDPTSISLNNSINSFFFNNQEYICANWVHDRNTNSELHADVYRRLLLISFEGAENTFDLSNDIQNISKNSLIYVGSYNINNNIFSYSEINISKISSKTNKIYSNAGAQVYHC